MIVAKNVAANTRNNAENAAELHYASVVGELVVDMLSLGGELNMRSNGEKSPHVREADGHTLLVLFTVEPFPHGSLLLSLLLL